MDANSGLVDFMVSSSESNRSQARLNHAVAAGALMGNGNTLDAAARSGLPAVGASAKAG
jgi:hypothetical protein